MAAGDRSVNGSGLPPVLPPSRLKSWTLAPERWLRQSIARVVDRPDRRQAGSFGWREALLEGHRLDAYSRYTAIIASLSPEPPGTKVLDVGAGGSGISDYLDTDRAFKVIVVDHTYPLAHAATVAGKPAPAVVGDGCHLPFRDGAFDVTVACDSLEHIERPRRASFCAELRRVAARRVVLHCPVAGAGDEFGGHEVDQRLQRWYRRTRGYSDYNLAQHTAYGLPTRREIGEFFPGARIRGGQNATVVERCMKLERIPYVRLVAGFYYLLFLRRRAGRPPFYGALVEWTAAERRETRQQQAVLSDAQ